MRAADAALAMATTLLHLQVDVATDLAFEFYLRLFTQLGLRMVDRGPDYAGVTDERVMLVLRRRTAQLPGEGRIGFRVDSRAEVDRFVMDFLTKEKIRPFAAPQADPARGGYYAVRFEAPDTTHVEVAWFPL